MLVVYHSCIVHNRQSLYYELMKKTALYTGVLVGAVLATTVVYSYSANRLSPSENTPAAVATSLQPQAPETPAPPLFDYIEVVDSCGPYFDGECVNLRSGPGEDYPAVRQLRNGIVLKVASTTTQNGRTWYQIGFDGAVRYPERIDGSWYVAADFVRPFRDVGQIETSAGLNASTTKRIVVERGKELLTAYDGDTVFMREPISTGLELTPTPRGTFWVYKKVPGSYMQGPLPGISDQYYDLPGVPWDLYFTYQGGAIHGAYWHDHFGQAWSHGCVNLPPNQAKKLYDWAELGTPVIVRD